ncbi:MAG: galactokinase [Spirochaetaceae bacterium]|nr:MAG: galactokinase [Spirochaetaceae bacterium]
MVVVASSLVNAIWSSPCPLRILRAMISQSDFASLSLEQRIGLLYPDVPAAAANRRLTNLCTQFSNHFGRFPTESAQFVSAPGRTEIAGNHTDHNNGLVIAASVQLDVLGIVEQRADRVVTVYSHGYPQRFTVDVSERAPRDEERGRFESLVRGVAAGLAAMGIEPVGFDCCMHSTVAAGSGLSSSAAVEVFLTAAFCAAANRDQPDPVTTAILCQRAENHYFGKPCGLMDQIACAHGGAVAIDFADSSAPVVTALDFSPADNGLALVVVESGASHDDLTDEYAAVPAEMTAVARALGAITMREVSAEQLLATIPKLRESLSERAILRAFHFHDENRRVIAQTEALRSGRIDRFLELVSESGDSSWRLLQNCAAASHGPRQELALGLALSDRLPARASRVHGGGFAGTMQAYVPREQLDAYRSEMERVMGAGAVTELFIRPMGPVVVGRVPEFPLTDS